MQRACSVLAAQRGRLGTLKCRKIALTRVVRSVPEDLPSRRCEIPRLDSVQPDLAQRPRRPRTPQLPCKVGGSPRHGLRTRASPHVVPGRAECVALCKPRRGELDLACQELERDVDGAAGVGGDLDHARAAEPRAGVPPPRLRVDLLPSRVHRGRGGGTLGPVRRYGVVDVRAWR